jgi:hypothetical protein
MARRLRSVPFRNTFPERERWEVHRAARKHTVPDEDTTHAASHAIMAYPLTDDGQPGPVRELLLGPDRAGNLLEIVALVLDDDRRLIIRSMPMRPKYRALLP